MSEHHPSTSERRRHIRIQFDRPAKLFNNTDSWECQLLDISLKGALLECLGDGNPQQHETYQLEVYLDDDTTIISMALKIVHIAGKHLGGACITIDYDSIAHLKRLVELNIGDPQLLDRELERMIDK